MNLVMRTFGRAIKPLFDIGIGQIPGVSPLYKCIWRYLGPKGVRLAEVNGFKMYVICRDWAVAPSLIFAHVWNPTETKIFRQHIKEGMTVIDVGAYIGYYSLLASRLVGDKGRVYAFEPSPECLGLLHKNIQLNNCKNIQVFEKAVTDKSGHTTFYLSPRNLSTSSTLKTFQDQRQIKVLTTTLDETIGDDKIDFIKIDIEGGETKALKGMSRIIENSPNLRMMIEVYPRGLAEAGTNLEKYIGLLQYYFHLHICGKRELTSEVGLRDIRKAVRRPGVINLFCRRRS